MKIITPFVDPGESLCTGPSQGLVYAVDQGVVLKVPFEYPALADARLHYLLDQSLKSFVSLEKELSVYDALKVNPHRNIARRLETGQTDCIFLERLTPLEEVWPDSTEPDRQRWALELLDAVRWLEQLGWAHGDLAVRNLGVDGANRLKLFDFGSATTSSHEDFANDVRRDHFHLATCLHFILSGRDPLAGLHSYREVESARATLSAGKGGIAKGAEVIAEIIQDGWTGRSSSGTFYEVFQRASGILGALDRDAMSDGQEAFYMDLESRCKVWLQHSERDPAWRKTEDYAMVCREVGHEGDLDVWR
ncbi:Uncharacterized protein TPAR_03704 [Tolypocladium paradoxum]|uniref:Protein kinase domain-containing protein n=1 Tax=Tolypocladium paradoxum TaxID=94208 RepID=A0A2S4L0Z8_9HYPO|nr:Uncharacterized protein TPAR_03704 [Tolypocladium paradoxum]